MAQEPVKTKVVQTTGDSGDGYKGNGKPEPGVDEYLKAIAAAQEQLKKAESALAKYQDELKLKDTLPKIYDEYKDAYPQLEHDKLDLDDFYNHEKAALSQVLTPVLVDKIDKIAKAAVDEIKGIEDRIACNEEKLDAWRRSLPGLKSKAESEKTEFEAVKKPAASIGARLKKAAARKSEVQKAHDDGDYAVAYWFLTSPRKLKGDLDAYPPLIEPRDLANKVKLEGDDYFKAAAAVAELEAKIKAGEAALKADQTLLAERSKSFDARVIQELEDLHPPHPQNQNPQRQQQPMPPPPVGPETL